mgnify:FL=1
MFIMHGRIPSFTIDAITVFRVILEVIWLTGFVFKTTIPTRGHIMIESQVLEIRV